jgi:fatty-acyl-CoA synthase
MTSASGICCIPDMARHWSGKTPDKAALIDPDRVVTYAQLNDRSNRIANALAEAGIRPGSHVVPGQELRGVLRNLDRR